MPRGQGGGRPRIELDWPIFDALCGVSCTLAEIAAYFKCSEDTIERAVRREKGMKFAAYHASHAAIGVTSIRRKQFQMALAGNVTMLVWLGKNLLKQTDKVESKQEISGPGGGPVEVNVDAVRERLESRITSIASRLGTLPGPPGAN